MADMSKVSDGYHTFGELYEHRIVLWIALCRIYTDKNHRNADVCAWRTKLHSDGSSFDGWFLLGLGKSQGEQMTYHLPMGKWEQCDFAVELDKAPEFDGHTSADVLTRIEAL